MYISQEIAKGTLYQLSELSRHNLYEGDHETVLLEKEVRHIKNFVEFSRIKKEQIYKWLCMKKVY